ncbi:hypothetical protein EZH22_23550 [Xanthobacter dioxanivorans]|uniref:Phasin domain-containing protein n=1 Tax=Xanthobacter dioxanivorans TaxID=2528964 RepID=A0A974SJ28_9HYPH|nr:hypothetical protein [Xanthobacter dioxanivorans]QRG05963.1 hypothetical protein EZH22_23550 [Xanthobacter dioxanivorans]
MNDSVMFQGLARAFSANTPSMAWPIALWKNCFFDCPLAVSSHVQQFVGRQMQEQVQLLADLSREQNPSAALSREAAFLQQSALAWNNELLEVAELVRGRLLTATQADAAPEAQPPYARAA